MCACAVRALFLLELVDLEREACELGLDGGGGPAIQRAAARRAVRHAHRVHARTAEHRRRRAGGLLLLGSTNGGAQAGEVGRDLVVLERVRRRRRRPQSRLKRE